MSESRPLMYLLLSDIKYYSQYGDKDESNYPNFMLKRKSMGAALLSVQKREKGISAALSRLLSAPATHYYVQKSAFPTCSSGLP